MIECPKCWSNFSGHRCSCGYEVKVSHVHVSPDRSERLKRLQREAYDWLIDHGIINEEMQREERMTCIREFVRGFKGSNMRNPDPMAWAKGIVRDYKAGTYTYHQGYKNACEALGIEAEIVHVG